MKKIIFNEENISKLIETFRVKAQGEKLSGKAIMSSLNGFQPTSTIENGIILRNPIDIMSKVYESVSTSMIEDVFKGIDKPKGTTTIPSVSEDPSDPDIYVRDNRDFVNKIDSPNSLSFFQKISIAASKRSSGVHLKSEFVSDYYGYSDTFHITDAVETLSDPAFSSDFDTVNAQLDKFCHLANKLKNFDFIQKAGDVKKLHSDIEFFNGVYLSIGNYISDNLKEKGVVINKSDFLTDLLGDNENNQEFETTVILAEHLIESSKIIAILFYDGILDKKADIPSGDCASTKEKIDVNALAKSLKIVADSMVNEIFYKSSFNFSVRVVETFDLENNIALSTIINLDLPNDLAKIFNRYFVLNIKKLNSTLDVINEKAEVHVNMVGEFDHQEAS